MGPREWWWKCGRGEDGELAGEQQEQGSLQQQQQLANGAHPGGGAVKGAAGKHVDRSWGEKGTKPLRTVIPVCISPSEPCDWCQGPCPDNKQQQQKDEEEQGTAAVYGCSLCGLARYCSEGCGKAARPCHDKNCWRFQALATGKAAMQEPRNLFTPMFKYSS